MATRALDQSDIRMASLKGQKRPTTTHTPSSRRGGQVSFFFFFAGEPQATGPDWTPVVTADIVLGDPIHYVSNSGDDPLQKRAGNNLLREYTELLGKSLKERFGCDVRIDGGRYRRGSYIFEFIGIALPAVAVVKFLKGYPSVSKGINVLVSDIEKVVVFTATAFSVQHQESLRRVDVRPQSQRKIKKAVSNRKKPKADQEQKHMKGRTGSQSTPLEPST